MSLLGRQNVGKSSLINTILGQDRQVVSDFLGTTRDSIEIDFNYNDKQYTLIDTAGIRRKKSHIEQVEKISIVKALNSAAISDITVLMIDARVLPTQQDNRLFNLLVKKGVPIILCLETFWAN